MIVYMKRGSTFFPTSEEDLNIQEKLPAGNFLVKQTPTGQWYFDPVDSFKSEGKIYGSSETMRERMYNTYLDRPNSTGIMLAGEKGCGKSMLARMLSVKFEDEGHPCLIINTPYCGDSFNKLIQDIDQPCMILFDEFEKVYSNNEAQMAVLTLFDGVFPSKKMFVLTCNNNKYKIDEHMRNRPGRIYYMIDYIGLEEQFIRDYCDDVLKNKSHIDQLCQIAGVFTSFNFDMLKAIVEEMNRYNESPIDVVKLLNSRPTLSEVAKFGIVITINGVNAYSTSIQNWAGSPIAGTIPRIQFYKTEDEYDDDKESFFTCSSDKLISMNVIEGVYIFGADGIEITFAKLKNNTYNAFANFD